MAFNHVSQDDSLSIHINFEYLLRPFEDMPGVRAMLSRSAQPPVAAQGHRWRDLQSMAEHIKYIESKPEVKEPVYVVEDDSKKTCSNATCPEQTKYNAITIEPILDFGTVTVAHDVVIESGVMLPFRRNGPLMDNPLWTQYVKRMTSQERPAYCLGCLRELYTRSREGWEVMDKLAHKRAHSRPHVPLIQHPESKAESHDRRESTSPIKYGESLNPVHGPLALDELNTVTRNASGSKVKDRLKGSSVKNYTSAQPAVRTGHIDVPHRPSRFFPQTPLPNQQPTTASTNHTVSVKTVKDTEEEDYQKLGSSAITGSYPDFDYLWREEGRGINTRAFYSFLESRTRQGLAAKLATMLPDTRDFARSVNEAGPSTPKHFAGTSPGSGSSWLSSVPSNLSTQAFYTPIPFNRKGKASTSIDPNSSPLSDIPSDLSNPNILKKGKGKKVTFAPSHKPQPHFTPVFRRVPATQGPPPGVSELEYAAFLRRVPDKHDLICLCHQPAQTYDVRIAQCNAPDCPIGWIHYNCGDTTFRRSVQHQTQVCELCRNERYFADSNNLRGSSASQTTPPLPLTGEDVVAAVVPNMGGFTASRNPYGLAGNIDAGNEKPPSPLSPLAPSFVPASGSAEASAPGVAPAVGSAMAMGLAPSRPALFTEAYTMGAQLAREADERFARSLPARVARDGYDYSDDEWDDEMEYEGPEADDE